jgi:hypothetical protein
VAAPNKPPLLYVLAAFGLVLGSFGALYAPSSAMAFLGTRDQFVSALRDEAQRYPLIPAEPKARAQFLELAEREAEVLYTRRGVALPLAAMNLIVSLLLLAGAMQAMRGEAWGVSAWSLAAAVNIPYTILSLLFFLVETRELNAVFREAGGAVGESRVLQQHVKALGAMIAATVELVYFCGTWLYLRRPALKKLYEA